MLQIIGGLRPLPWRTFDDLDGVLSLAEAWGAKASLVSCVHLPLHPCSYVNRIV